MTLARDHARAVGPIASGHYRVVVLESDSRLTHRDFDILARAKAYADDAASEDAEDPPLAYVFDSSLQRVHSGRSYWRR